MKQINIMSLVQASVSLVPASFQDFLKLHQINIKPAEIEDLKCLVKETYASSNNVNMFDSFYVGYKIPQIGKEFDLLRFGKNYIVNIELKQTCLEQKIAIQLMRNRYYLFCIGRPVYTFTYVSDIKALYYLQADNTLIRTDICHLPGLLVSQDVDRSEIVDKLFDPSDYLVSPFNATQKFLREEYFLTHQQEEIKSQILQKLAGPKIARFISVKGSAGTGKTLLVYDTAKEMVKASRSHLIIHCGKLNEGQHQLIGTGWNIVSIKDYLRYDFKQYSLVIVDEAQRITSHQLKTIVAKVEDSLINCIFSYDKLQTLSDSEHKNNIDAEIGSIRAVVTYKLSEKIRTNKEIATFIKVLFNSKRNLTLLKSNNIEITFFDNLEDAKSYLESLHKYGWEVLRFTPSQYTNEHHEKYYICPRKTSHQVIGQEFDGVAVTIDQFFSYDVNGDLYYRGKTYYQMAKMLFQNITRARKRLNVVIINNPEVMARCISVLG